MLLLVIVLVIEGVEHEQENGHQIVSARDKVDRYQLIAAAAPMATPPGHGVDLPGCTRRQKGYVPAVHRIAMPRVKFTCIALLLVWWPHDAGAAGLWDDRPVKVSQTIDMQFPPALLMDGISRGEARVVLEVDETGRLTDFLVTGFSHREIAAELQRMLPTFEFEPARQRGTPVGSRFEVIFSFEARGAVMSLSPLTTVGAQFSRFGPSGTALVARSGELDRPVTAVHQVAPYHPGKALKPAIATGAAQIDFYIDANGRPRMPVVLRATHQAFAAAAVDALLQWRFDPPTHQGRPVMVRVVQQFEFTSSKAPAAPPG